MNAHRRNVLTWSSGAAAMLAFARQAGGQTPAGYEFVDKVVMLAELKVKPGQLEPFLAYTVPNLAVSRAAAGNLAFDILIDDAQAETVFFYEVWASQRAQQDYMAGRIRAGDLTKLLSFLVGAPKFTRLRSVAA